MPVKLATLRRSTDDRSVPFTPSGGSRRSPDEFGYVEEEWFANGDVDGHPYATSVFVRRPPDKSRFSGVVVVEPLHAMSAAPIWIYTSAYMMRSGHGWAAVCSQKSALDAWVKPFDADRYASLEIWSDAPPVETPGLAPVPRDPAAMADAGPLAVNASRRPGSMTVARSPASACQSGADVSPNGVDSNVIMGSAPLQR